MGLLRLILALSVVIHHTGAVFGYELFDGPLTVSAFFVISGFYMSLILHEKYTSPNFYYLYITNRLIRIYPTYWLILALTVITYFAFYHFGISTPDNENIFTHLPNIFEIISNITLLIRVDYFDINPNNWHPLLIAPAWTLVMELLFYFVAPFIVRNKIKIVTFLICGLAIRYFVYHYALTHNIPLTTRFFPSEIIFFLSGSLSYSMYSFLRNKTINKKIIIILSAFLLLITLTYHYIPLDYTFRWLPLKGYFYILVLFFLLPFVFLLSKNNKFDTFLGSLSYPIYLSHPLISMILITLFGRFNNKIFSLLVIIITCFVSTVIVKIFEDPIERWRQVRVKKASK